MKISASIKAFILSFLITGNLALLLWGYQIKKRVPDFEEEEYDIEYAAEIPDEELFETSASPKSTTTHRAFNQTRRELAALNNQSQSDEDDFEKRLRELDNAIKDVEQAKENPNIDKVDPYEADKKKANADGNDSNSSIRYRLVNRNAIFVPNPVYTCAGSGTVVVNIQVNADGLVTDQKINEASSDTRDGCLWDAALNYASETVFNSASKAIQLGSITYYFPGQG